MNKISLSSWNYGSFSFSKNNPYYQYQTMNSANNNINNNNKISAKKGNNNIKIVKKQHFENFPYEKYIDRDSNIKKEFRIKSKQERSEELKIIKKNEKTFDTWEKQKHKKIREEKKK